MTVININNISGIASVNAQSGSLELFTNAGASLLDLNANLATFPADITFRNINTTGIITASKFVGVFEADSGSTGTFDSLTVSGNVSVGGTLTYDDVTNVDSLGIITARSYVSIADSIVHTGDIDTSIRFPSDNTFTVETGSSERLRITGIGSVGISSAIPKTDVDISQRTGAVALPQGTTAQRPTGSAPYIRKNTTNSSLEFYNGTEWVEIITDYFPTGSVILG